MNTHNDGGPAMPDVIIIPDADRLSSELTKRQHAAIHLRVPDSGTPWLDDMIRQSLRNDLVEVAMAIAGTLINDQTIGECAKELGLENYTFYNPEIHYPILLANRAKPIADALLAAMEKKQC